MYQNLNDLKSDPTGGVNLSYSLLSIILTSRGISRCFFFHEADKWYKFCNLVMYGQAEITNQNVSGYKFDIM